MNWRIQAALELMGSGMRYRALTSEPTDEYNCIAWAMDDVQNFWWPSGKGYWPGRRKGQDLAPTLDVFRAAFATRGYSSCSDATLEHGVQKVALYGIGSAIMHAARQLPSGYWTSKLGHHADIEHELQQIEGQQYGYVVAYMSRLLTP
jgi:hypothetical protein